MLHRRRFIPLLLLAAFLSACSSNGNGDGSQGPDLVNVAGTWDVVITVVGGNQAAAGTEFSATFTLAQDGSQVTGTFATEGGLAGQIAGTASTTGVDFTITQGNPCPGTFSGSATVNGNSIEGSYQGSDCDGTLQADFVGSRR